MNDSRFIKSLLMLVTLLGALGLAQVHAAITAPTTTTPTTSTVVATTTTAKTEKTIYIPAGGFVLNNENCGFKIDGTVHNDNNSGSEVTTDYLYDTSSEYSSATGFPIPETSCRATAALGISSKATITGMRVYYATNGRTSINAGDKIQLSVNSYNLMTGNVRYGDITNPLAQLLVRYVDTNDIVKREKVSASWFDDETLERQNSYPARYVELLIDNDEGASETAKVLAVEVTYEE